MPALHGQGTMQPLFLADQTYSSYGNNKAIDDKIAKAQTLMDPKARAEAYAYATEKGMRIVELSKGDMEAWRACSAPLLESYIERAGPAGPKLFAAYGKLRTAPCCREAPGDGDQKQ